jgi:Malate/L-lactate dehydrogenase
MDRIVSVSAAPAQINSPCAQRLLSGARHAARRPGSPAARRRRGAKRECGVPIPCSTGYKHYFVAYNIAAFTDVDTFKAHMDQMLEWLRETRPAPGQKRVLYPGLLEYEEDRERPEHGIPLHKEVLQWFDKITSELGVPPLVTL